MCQLSIGFLRSQVAALFVPIVVVVEIPNPMDSFERFL
jgi:hypothetical protein